MANSERLTVAEALAQARLIDEALGAWEKTAPNFVSSVGGRDCLARMSDMTCVGPVPRLDVDAWQMASDEHLQRWEQSAHERRASAPPPPEFVLPGCPESAPAPKRSRWAIFSR